MIPILKARRERHVGMEHRLSRTGYNWVKLSERERNWGNRRNSIIHKEGKRSFRL